MDISVNCKPGEFVAQGLFAEFTVLAEKKIEQVLNCPVSLNVTLKEYTVNALRF